MANRLWKALLRIELWLVARVGYPVDDQAKYALLVELRLEVFDLFVDPK